MGKPNSDEWRVVNTDWKGDMGFLGINQAGGEVQMGSVNGKPGISPMEMLLLGVAGCTGMDVVSILKKMRQDLQDLRITVRGKRAEDHPKIFTEIEVIYELWGNIDPKAVEDAIELSEDKYCSASAMLRCSAIMQSRYQIHPAKV